MPTSWESLLQSEYIHIYAVIGYAFFINIMTFFYFGLDKIRAIAGGKTRIPEKTLFILIGIGGSIGALAAMNVFRHKTKKTSFHLILAGIIVIHLLLIILFII